MIDLSVVTVGFQSRNDLFRCLTSIGKTRRQVEIEIIVVDNASTDGTREMIRKDFANVTLIENAQNLGFARANNLGLQRATGRYWMLLNPDTEIPDQPPDPFDELVKFMDSHPRAAACGPRLEYGNRSFQHSAFRFPTLMQVYLDLFPANWRLRESWLNGRYPKRLYYRGMPFPIDHPLGAACVVRPEAVAQVGWLDEDYFMYVEEIDWCLRFKRAGWEIWCVPKAVIIHYEAQSTRQFREQMFVELWRARLKFFRKYHSQIFNAIVARLIWLGMRRAEKEAVRLYQQGRISQPELESRVSAYRRISQLAGVLR